MASVAFDGNDFRFYADGQLKSVLSKNKGEHPLQVGNNFDQDGSLEALSNNNNDIILGLYRPYPNDPSQKMFKFTGYIKELMIFDQKLTACQIKRVYVETKPF